MGIPLSFQDSDGRKAKVSMSEKSPQNHLLINVWLIVSMGKSRTQDRAAWWRCGTCLVENSQEQLKVCNCYAHMLFTIIHASNNQIHYRSLHMPLYSAAVCMCIVICLEEWIPVICGMDNEHVSIWNQSKFKYTIIFLAAVSFVDTLCNGIMLGTRAHGN